MNYIKLYSKLLNWQWYNSLNVRVLFIHLLLKANLTETKWQDTTIKQGQLVTNLDKLATETCLTKKQTRIALDKLKKSGEIVCERAGRLTLVCLVNYGLYQDLVIEKGTQRARKGHAKRAT